MIMIARCLHHYLEANGNSRLVYHECVPTLEASHTPAFLHMDVALMCDLIHMPPTTSNDDTNGHSANSAITRDFIASIADDL